MTDKLNIMINDDIEYQKTPKGFIRFVSGHDFIDYIRYQNPNAQIEILSLKYNLGYWRPDGCGIIDFLIESNIEPNQIDLVGDDEVEISHMTHFIETAREKQKFLNPKITKLQYAKETPTITL